MQLQRIGIGAGQKEFAWPNIARLWLGEAVDAGQLVQIETNIDDMNPELYGPISEQLFAAGALDVWTTAIGMKKGRPGVLLSVLAPQACETILSDLLLRETTTLGVRVHTVHRHEAARDFVTVATRYGAIPIKRKWLDGQVVGVKPEYAICQQLAQQQGVPVRMVYEAALTAAHQQTFPSTPR